jgi:hypothetical protein
MTVESVGVRKLREIILHVTPHELAVLSSAINLVEYIYRYPFYQFSLYKSNQIAIRIPSIELAATIPPTVGHMRLLCLSP